MKIQKIINNNAVYSLNDEQEEIIMMGSGIGYRKQIGEEVDIDKVEKVFSLKNQNFDKFEKIFKRVDPIYFDIAMIISQKAEELLCAKMSEQLIFALADHIFFSVSRFKKGVFTPNLMRHEIKALYPKEYQIGDFGRQVIYKKLSVDLPKDESGYIALHIVNSDLSEKPAEVGEVIILLHGIRDIVKKEYGELINEDSYEYTLFVAEIKRLAHRMFSKNGGDLVDVDELMPLLLGKNKELTLVIHKISAFIQNQFDYTMKKEDEVYLMMQILRIVK